MIPIVLVLLIGFSVGLTAKISSASGTRGLILEHGGAFGDQLEKAYALVLSHDYAGAAVLATSVIRSDPDNSLAYHILGLANARRGLTEEAALNFSKATELEPQFALAWFNLGVVEEKRGGFARALEAYRQAAELNPARESFDDAVRRVEKVLKGEGRWDWHEAESERLFLEGIKAVNRAGREDLIYAENIFRSLLADRPYDVASRNMLGLTLAKKGETREAEQLFIQVVEAEPGYSDAWYNLGMVHESQGRLEEALRDFQTAHEVSSLDTFRETAEEQIARIRQALASERALAPPPAEEATGGTAAD
jgi:tetratricopeptide (TPR) repeat protein